MPEVSFENRSSWGNLPEEMRVFSPNTFDRRSFVLKGSKFVGYMVDSVRSVRDISKWEYHPRHMFWWVTKSEQEDRVWRLPRRLLTKETSKARHYRKKSWERNLKNQTTRNHSRSYLICIVLRRCFLSNYPTAELESQTGGMNAHTGSVGCCESVWFVPFFTISFH